MENIRACPPRHSKSLNATACARLCTCLLHVLARECMDSMCVCLQPLHVFNLCVCVCVCFPVHVGPSDSKEDPHWDYASADRRRG